MDRRTFPWWVTTPLGVLSIFFAVFGSYILWGAAGVILVCGIIASTGCLVHEGVRNILGAADEIVANHFDDKRE